MRCDAAVIGGGLVGTACADALAGEGLAVRLFEAGTLAREASWAGAGILHPIHPWIYPEPLHPLLRAGFAAYERVVPALERDTGIDVRLERSGLVVMDAELDRLAAWLDEDVPKERSDDARVFEPALREGGPALLLPAAAHVTSHRLAEAFAARARARGARIHERCAVTALREGVVETAAGPCEARWTVLCAGAWAARLYRTLRVEPVRGQILLYRTARGPRRMVLLRDGTYAVPRRDGRVLFGSTLERVGFEPRPTQDALKTLSERAFSALGLRPRDLEAAWAGLRPGTPDSLPYLGFDAARADLLHASGHYRNGILLAPLTAGMIADLACGRVPGFNVAAFTAFRCA